MSHRTSAKIEVHHLIRIESAFVNKKITIAIDLMAKDVLSPHALDQRGDVYEQVSFAVIHSSAAQHITANNCYHRAPQFS